MLKLNIKPYHVLLIVSLLDMMSAGLLMPQLANHALSIGASHISLGLMGSLYSASQLISAPIIGSLSDLRGRKQMLLKCLGVCAVCYVYLGITSSVLVFLTLRVIIGLTKQVQLLTKALTPDHVEGDQNQAVLYGRLAALSGLGMTLGPVAGGYIVEAYPNYGFSLITSAMGVIFLFNSVLINSLPDKQLEAKEKKEQQIAPKLIDSIKQPLKESIDEFYKIDWTVFGDIFLYKLLITFSLMMYFGTFGLFLRTEHSVSPKNIGYLVSVQAITGSICNYFIAHINSLYKNDLNFTRRNLHIFVTVTLSFISLALAPNVFIFTILLIPLAVSTSVCRIVHLEMVNKRAGDDRRGTIIGASNSVKSLSGVVTPLISGLVNEYLGVIYGFFVSASFTAVGIVISYKLRRKSLETKVKSS